MTLFFAFCFGVLLVCVFTGAIRRKWVHDGTPEISSKELHGGKTGKLHFVLHGYAGPKREADIAGALRPYGKVIGLYYPHGAKSEDPLKVAAGLAKEIERHARAEPDREIVLVGESMGALLIRRAYLDGLSQPWSKRVSRIVLLAGMNRGWDITGRKPADMAIPQWFAMWFGSWLGRIMDIGRLPMAMETGAPFVANLRLDWMRELRELGADAPEVVQLRGDIDDIVSDEDSKDLGAIQHAKFAWLRVRGTGHGDIAFFSDETKEAKKAIGDYRKEKFLIAATKPFDQVQQHGEKDTFHPDLEVTHVVFVLHGIRDLGQWAAAFEQDLQKEFAKVSGPKGKLAVESIRYGYFGMGPFLFMAKRQNFVRWLMDEYTETLARYPNATEIHFTGHSNGTYLLASALDQYRSLRIDRVAFGGSVVRKNYDWPKIIDNHQVESVRNYVAADDWIVALFPRFFEPWLSDMIFSNDLGSAGFNGFTHVSARVTNVAYLTGGHGAFLDRTAEISRFLLLNDATFAKTPRSEQSTVWSWGSSWATWVLVWPLILSVLVFVGWHVVMSATEPRWPFFLGYVLLLLALLWTA